MKKSLLVALFVLVSVLAHAQSPRTISYQGLIRGATIGNHSITITLYSDAAGTEKLWQSTTNTLLDSSGVFNTMLGSASNPLPDAQAMDRPLWLGISIDNLPELRPLSQLSSSPYSLNVADSSITASKMGTNYISSISVNGQQISGVGSNVKIVTGNGIQADWIDSTLLLSGTGYDTGYKAQQIVSGSGVGGANNPCTSNSDGSNGYNTVSGGCQNLAIGGTNGYATISGGDSNSVHYDYGTVSGGYGNTVLGLEATVGGGSMNQVGNNIYDAQHQTVGGGFQNFAGGDDATVAGGENNSVPGGHSAIAGGYKNYAADTGSFVGGGEYDSAVGNHAAVLGGFENWANGNFSAVLGGQYLVLGNNSVGYNGGFRASTQIDLSAYSDVGYFGNVDLWIGNIDDVARGIRFYSANHDFGYTTSHYSSFKAGNQTGNILYTLPTSLPSSTGYVLGVSSLIDTNVELSWEPGSAGWLLTGNAGTNPDTNYLGTQDSEAFQIRVHNNTLDTSGGNQRVMQYSEGSTSPNMLGGSNANSVGGGLTGSAIVWGGTLLAPNRIDSLSPFSVILSGIGNHITGAGSLAGYDLILGGRGNFMGSDLFQSDFNIIVGGDSNHIDYGNYDNFLGGGKNNWIDDAYGVIVGGLGNSFSSESGYNAIVGGRGNSVGYYSSWNTMGAGDSNAIGNYDSYSTVTGGQHNKIDSEAWWGTIPGGMRNYIGNYIYCGHIPGDDGPVGCDTLLAPYNVISGGDSNTILGTSYGAIGGGRQNLIVPFTVAATIPGGDSLIANGYGQTVIGFHNAVSNITINEQEARTPNFTLDDPLFIVGNGNTNGPSNAFTVSYDGHSTVFQNQGIRGAINPTIFGSTYANNTVIAWGDVPAGTTGTGSGMTDGIGAAVTTVTTGVYTVTLNVNDPSGGAHAFTAGGAALVATPTSVPVGNLPAAVTCTPLLAGPPATFTVTTFNLSTGSPDNTIGFQFHIIAR